MSALLKFNGAAATKCTASGTHVPTPIRYVWHHIQPEGAGGETAVDNLAEVCDSCHYTIHVILWLLAQQEMGATLDTARLAVLKRPPRQAQYLIAQAGYVKCMAANTVALIPDEGGVPA